MRVTCLNSICTGSSCDCSERLVRSSDVHQRLYLAAHCILILGFYLLNIMPKPVADQHHCAWDTKPSELSKQESKLHDGQRRLDLSPSTFIFILSRVYILRSRGDDLPLRRRLIPSPSPSSLPSLPPLPFTTYPHLPLLTPFPSPSSLYPLPVFPLPFSPLTSFSTSPPLPCAPLPLPPPRWLSGEGARACVEMKLQTISSDKEQLLWVSLSVLLVLPHLLYIIRSSGWVTSLGKGETRATEARACISFSAVYSSLSFAAITVTLMYVYLLLLDMMISNVYYDWLFSVVIFFSMFIFTFGSSEYKWVVGFHLECNIQLTFLLISCYYSLSSTA